ncbi:hypothetical protein AYI70_g1004 [Smittium culicis]|uniref:Uncharacterized protein n=1 Tax=Smittium culicis TaxID=133412 RepID=A0A1R1XMA6_9FUNG|nr:hypothetical protein AYI70_g7029 [Smittium culicis]OMJ25281.1 hypothetical protein AYI70_g1004 [Smittium culicis]
MEYRNSGPLSKGMNKIFPYSGDITHQQMGFLPLNMDRQIPQNLQTQHMSNYIKSVPASNFTNININGNGFLNGNKPNSSFESLLKANRSKNINNSGRFKASKNSNIKSAYNSDQLSEERKVKDQITVGLHNENQDSFKEFNPCTYQNTVFSDGYLPQSMDSSNIPLKARVASNQPQIMNQSQNDFFDYKVLQLDPLSDFSSLPGLDNGNNEYTKKNNIAFHPEFDFSLDINNHSNNFSNNDNCPFLGENMIKTDSAIQIFSMLDHTEKEIDLSKITNTGDVIYKDKLRSPRSGLYEFENKESFKKHKSSNDSVSTTNTAKTMDTNFQNINLGFLNSENFQFETKEFKPDTISFDKNGVFSESTTNESNQEFPDFSYLLTPSSNNLDNGFQNSYKSHNKDAPTALLFDSTEIKTNDTINNQQFLNFNPQSKEISNIFINH